MAAVSQPAGTVDGGTAVHRIRWFDAKKCLVVLLFVLSIAVLSGCEANRGWKALTGTGAYWDVLVTVQFKGGVWSENVQVRYLGEERISRGYVEVGSSLYNGGSMKLISPGPIQRTVDRSTRYHENPYFTWRDVDRRYRSAEFYITWADNGREMSETVTVTDR